MMQHLERFTCAVTAFMGRVGLIYSDISLREMKGLLVGAPIGSVTDTVGYAPRSSAKPII